MTTCWRGLVTRYLQIVRPALPSPIRAEDWRYPPIARPEGDPKRLHLLLLNSIERSVQILRRQAADIRKRLPIEWTTEALPGRLSATMRSGLPWLEQQGQMR